MREDGGLGHEHKKVSECMSKIKKGGSEEISLFFSVTSFAPLRRKMRQKEVSK